MRTKTVFQNFISIYFDIFRKEKFNNEYKDDLVAEDFVEEKIVPANQPIRITLKRPLVRSNKIRKETPKQTADELVAKMNARHKAILSGDYSVIEPTWKLNSY